MESLSRGCDSQPSPNGPLHPIADKAKALCEVQHRDRSSFVRFPLGHLLTPTNRVDVGQTIFLHQIPDRVSLCNLPKHGHIRLPFEIVSVCVVKGSTSCPRGRPTSPTASPSHCVMKPLSPPIIRPFVLVGSYGGQEVNLKDEVQASKLSVPLHFRA